LLRLLIKDSGSPVFSSKRAGEARQRKCARSHHMLRRTGRLLSGAPKTNRTDQTHSRGTVFGFPESFAILFKLHWRVKQVDVENARIGCVEVI
jgi:hypothetical protein